MHKHNQPPHPLSLYTRLWADVEKIRILKVVNDRNIVILDSRKIIDKFLNYVLKLVTHKIFPHVFLIIFCSKITDNRNRFPIDLI